MEIDERFFSENQDRFFHLIEDDRYNCNTRDKNLLQHILHLIESMNVSWRGFILKNLVIIIDFCKSWPEDEHKWRLIRKAIHRSDQACNCFQSDIMKKLKGFIRERKKNKVKISEVQEDGKNAG
jgi:hypothetical protein